MSTPKLDELMKLSQSRAETYLHVAKVMVIREFGPATEHSHLEVAATLASAMMQYEGAQIIADAHQSTAF